MNVRKIKCIPKTENVLADLNDIE